MQALDRHVIEATLMASSGRYCDLNHGRLDAVQDVGHFPKGCVVHRAGDPFTYSCGRDHNLRRVLWRERKRAAWRLTPLVQWEILKSFQEG